MLKKIAAAGCVLTAIVVQSDRLAVRAAGAYIVSTIDVPASSFTAACGIDILGRVVGYDVDGAGTHGFLLNNGAFSAIDIPGAAWTAAYGLNTAGQIVGAYGPNGSNGRHGFLRNGASFSSFDVPGSSDTVARSVNNRGQIVGDYLGPDGMRHGFLLSAGSYATIEFPESGGGAAGGINDAGEIAGVLGLGPAAQGFLFRAGAYSRIQFPGSNYTEVWGLNNVGDLVGQIDASHSPSRGFQRSSAGFDVIELPDTPFSWDARGINDLGQIVGAFTGADGKTHGYRATPTALRIGSDPGATQFSSNSVPVVIEGPVGPQGPVGPSGPPGPPGPSSSDGGMRGRGSPLSANGTRFFLARASDELLRAANQSSYVQKAIVDINVAINDINAAIAFAASHPTAASPTAPATRPNFTPPPRPAPERNVSLEMALNDLKNAFDAFAQVFGGDLGGLRAKTYSDIAAAANDVMAGMNAANAAFPALLSVPAAAVPPLSPGAFRLVAQHSGKCLDASGPADQLVPTTQQACSGAAGQQWRLKPVAGGYQIVSSLDSNRCLSLRNATTFLGARVFLSACSAAGNRGEIWSRETVGQNDRLVAVHSTQCMGVSQQSTADGAAILQYTCDGGRNELWAMQITAP